MRFASTTADDNCVRPSLDSFTITDLWLKCPHNVRVRCRVRCRLRCRVMAIVDVGLGICSCYYMYGLKCGVVECTAKGGVLTVGLLNMGLLNVGLGLYSWSPSPRSSSIPRGFSPSTIGVRVKIKSLGLVPKVYGIGYGL